MGANQSFNNKSKGFLGNKYKEHLMGHDPFQQNFVPKYNPYGQNYFAYEPRRRHHGRHHNRYHERHHNYGPFFSNYPTWNQPLVPGPYPGYNVTNRDYDVTNRDYDVVVNSPCGGPQCTAYKQPDGTFSAPIGTECTCCALGKPCRMNSPGSDIKFNDCCAGLQCNKGVCMKQ
jgi:hypothetical protein